MLAHDSTVHTYKAAKGAAGSLEICKKREFEQGSFNQAGMWTVIVTLPAFRPVCMHANESEPGLSPGVSPYGNVTLWRCTAQLYCSVGVIDFVGGMAGTMGSVGEQSSCQLDVPRTVQMKDPGRCNCSAQCLSTSGEFTH